jgi:hypothetical protein
MHSAELRMPRVSTARRELNPPPISGNMFGLQGAHMCRYGRLDESIVDCVEDDLDGGDSPWIIW